MAGLYTVSLRDALPIWAIYRSRRLDDRHEVGGCDVECDGDDDSVIAGVRLVEAVMRVGFENKIISAALDGGQANGVGAPVAAAGSNRPSLVSVAHEYAA